VTALSRTVLITGATGFVGSFLLRFFREQGWNAVGATRHLPAEADADWREYDVNWGSIPPTLLAGIDVVVHGAFVRRTAATDSVRVNVDAARRLFAEARERDVHPIFISSLAAHGHALSMYGKQKFEIERLLHGSAATVVRPGLVLGNGGLFRQMYDHMKHNRWVPLPGGGRQPLQTVLIDDLARAMLNVARDRICGTFVIAESPPILYKLFWLTLAGAMRRPLALIPAPFWCVELAAAAGSKLHLQLPVDVDNVLGLKAMQACPPTADSRVIDFRLRRYFESIDIVLPRMVPSFP
jgi:nucleoside-diphosphate-sugar epimerase